MSDELSQATIMFRVIEAGLATNEDLMERLSLNDLMMRLDYLDAKEDHQRYESQKQ